MNCDVLDGLHILTQEVQSITGSLQERVRIFNAFVGELVHFEEGHTHVVEASFNVMDVSGTRSYLVCQIHQNERTIVSHLSSQPIPLVHLGFVYDTLSDLVLQAFEIVAKVSPHCFINAKGQHPTFASDQLSIGDDVVIKL